MNPAELAATWIKQLAPKPRIAPSDWIESNVILPASSNAIPGPVKLTAAQKGMADAILEDDAEVVVFKLAAQSGKSLTIAGLIGWIIDRAPGPILSVHPTDASAAEWMRERFDPLVDSTLALKQIVGAGDKGVDNIDAKSFPGGGLYTASSFRSPSLAARPIKYLFCDEISRFALNATSGAAGSGEGDPISLAMRRTATYRRRKVILASTPTNRATCRVTEWAAKGDERMFAIPCPHCGEFAPQTFDRVIWDSGKPKTARLQCLACGCLLSERERQDALPLGAWTPTKDREQPNVISFVANALIAPWVSLAQLAAAAEAADDPAKRQTFANVWLAESYDEAADAAIDAPSLQAKAEEFSIPLPKEVSHLVAGVDCQADRLEASLVAALPNGQFAVIQHRVLPGDTAGPAPWALLDDMLGETIPTQDGRRLIIAATAVDSGYATSTVAREVARQRAKGRRVLATKGVSGWARPTIKEGQRIAKGLVPAWLIGVDPLKRHVQRALTLDRDAPNSIRLQAGLPQAYYDGLCSESLEVSYKKGYSKLSWIKDPSVNNEPLDALVYAIAVASTIKQAPPSVNQPQKRQSILERIPLLNTQQRELHL